MPEIYTPLSGADVPITLGGLNMRYQEFEDYILSLGSAGQTTITATAGEGLADRAAAYLNLSDGMIYQMDADAAGPRAGAIRGFVDGAVSSSASAMLVLGGVMDGFSGLTALLPVYVAASAGTITQTRPVSSSGGAQIMIAEMGLATATDTVYVAPKKIQYHKRNSFADNDTLTVQHHSDPSGFRRDIWAYITEAEAGAEAVGYSSSNQDSDVPLRDLIPATYSSDLCTGGTPLGNMTSADGLAGAFDGNPSTKAQIAGTAGIIGYDFATNRTIRKFTLTESTSLASGIMAKDFTLQYSSDNSMWNNAQSYSGETTWSDGETREFIVDAIFSARYWRINITNNNGSGFTAVGEVEMMEVDTYDYGSDKLAQTFTLSGSTDIAQVGLWLKKAGSPAGTCTVRIETVSSGNPTGSLADAAATITFSESSLGTSYAEKLLTFASSFTLSSGTYAIVLSTDRTADEANIIYWGADGSTPSYSGGSMRSLVGALWAAESKDAVFSVYEPGVTHPSKVSVDWWSSTYADVVNRYGDGSGGDLSTKTTFKCLRDSGFDDLTVVVELD